MKQLPDEDYINMGGLGNRNTIRLERIHCCKGIIPRRAWQQWRKSSQLTVIGFKIIEFITVMALVQKCKQGEKKIPHWRLGLNCFTKNHGEMKGIIQMTILEPLVHLYQKLGRCCRHNNIKIAFFVLLFYFQGLERTFLPLNFIPLQQ